MLRLTRLGEETTMFVHKSVVAAAVAVALISPFAAHAYCVPGVGDRPETALGPDGKVLQGGLAMSELEAGPFQGQWCGMREVGHEPLALRGSFGDVQLIGRCAYASMRDPSNLTLPTTGTSVIDMRVPSKPVWTKTLRTLAMQRAYSALEMQQNIMVSAFKDFGPNGDNWFDIYDVSGDCLNPAPLAVNVPDPLNPSRLAPGMPKFTTASGNHDGWLTPDTNTYYGVPFGALPGQSSDIRVRPSRIDLHVLDMSDKANPRPLLNWNRLQLPPEVQARTLAARNFHDVSTNNDGTRVYLALYGGNNALGGFDANGAGRCANGLMILDSSDIAFRRPNPQLRYISFLSWCDQQIDPDFGDGSTAANHAVEYVIHENGREYIVSTEESSDGLGGSHDDACQHLSFGRFTDISDDRNPRIVATFKPDVNKPQYCDWIMEKRINTGMLHYIGFDDRNKVRLVFYAAANQGIRVVDWRDPENPTEVAYYKAPSVATTDAGENDFTRPDPRYDQESCLLYTGWNQGGLRVLELTDPEYNPCMRRDVSGGGWIGAGGKNKIHLQLNAARGDGGRGALGGRLKYDAGNAKIEINRLTYLSGVRDACGDVLPSANAVQFNGSGTYNGAPASFRVCVQDNGEGAKASADLVHVACTSGCSYSGGGALGGGNIQVKQR
jgi:hypothetical protein